MHPLEKQALHLECRRRSTATGPEVEQRRGSSSRFEAYSKGIYRVP